MKIGVVNGPNLGSLGRREPAIYGRQSLAALMADCTAWAESLGVSLDVYQSNHEGSLIDFLEERGPTWDGLIINPGALAHYGLALRDAVAALPCPTIEVHLSNVQAREPFRRQSVLAPVTWGQIVGLGGLGYRLAISALEERARGGSTPESDEEKGRSTP